MWRAVDAFQRRIPMLDYLPAQNWKPARRISRGRLMGLCPLRLEHNPGCLVDPVKNLFYCYGCGRGGDAIRFVELYYGVRFGEAMMRLRGFRYGESLQKDAGGFCQIQSPRHLEAVCHLHRRGIRPPESSSES
jgi:DNA primase